MVLLAEDLGGHIAGGPARLLGILFLIMPGYTEISNSQISQFIQDDVLRFNISVNDVTLVKVVKCLQQAADKEFGLLLSELLLLINMVSEIPSRHVVQTYIEVFSVLKGIIHVDEEGMFQLRQNYSLVNNGVYTSLSKNSSLCHFLHCKQLVVLLEYDLPYFAESALSDAVHEVVVSLRDYDRFLVINVVCLELAIPHDYILKLK